MITAVFCKYRDFSKFRRFYYKSVSEFNVRTVFKPNANGGF